MANLLGKATLSRRETEPLPVSRKVQRSRKYLLETFTEWSARFRPAHMTVCALSAASLAAWLLAGAVAPPGAELPDAAAVRARIWSAPPSAVPPPPGIRQAAVLLVLPRISSGFGRRIDPIRGAPAIHFGIDIPGPLGTPIVAAAPGMVRFAGNAGGYGEMVEIDHGSGLVTRYGHLSRLLVHTGEAVAAGEPIARMGATGRATGSHLHFEVRRNGRPLDPLSFLGIPPTDAKIADISPEAAYLSRFARARNAGAHEQESDR